jgi:hypothetical protein
VAMVRAPEMGRTTWLFFYGFYPFPRLVHQRERGQFLNRGGMERAAPLLSWLSLTSWSWPRTSQRASKVLSDHDQVPHRINDG